MKFFTGIAAAAALFACSGVAQAHIYQITDSSRPDGSLVPDATYSNSEVAQGKGTTTDGYNFLIDSTYSGGISASFIEDVKSTISSADLSLYSGVYSGVVNAANLINTTGLFDPNVHTPTLVETSLAAGNYYILANVNPGASGRANYTVSIALDDISSAPEPGMWALMIAGVGLAGAAFRRSRRYRTAGLLA